MNEELPEKKRRVRYRGTHPRRFAEKYKELNPDKYAGEVQKVKERGHTPAGMHRPICVTEILNVLSPKPGETGLDATLGFGGHAEELLKCIVPDGKLFAMDVDPLELPRTEARLRERGFGEAVFQVRKMNFAGMHKLLPETAGGFDFILADLGISSMQLDNPARGFTFKKDGPLDLRLNPERGQPAAAIIKTLSENALEKILWLNADEIFAQKIAAAIFLKRQEINTTLALADTIHTALSPLAVDDVGIGKAIQRTFQALRIAVNDEFSALDQFLRSLPLVLKPHGRVAILSFHSGEDNRVLKAFENGLASGIYTAYATEPIRPDAQERYDNPRSKSARLRWAVKA